MIHLASSTWNKSNRSEKIESILTALNSTGTAEVEYFKCKTDIISYYLWKKDPQPISEDDEWNYAKITYQGKVALDFLELRVYLFKSTPEFGGHFFDEHFTESENQCIINALNDAEIITYRASLTKGKKLFLLFGIMLGLFGTLYWLIDGNYLISVLLLCGTLCLIWLLLLK
ncbi:MAG: hypothetical protein PVF58_16480 [Candidatus Methanofastidiosia archaeon]|jgi:hypothetical protein